jgi:hypothetical protein
VWHGIFEEPLQPWRIVGPLCGSGLERLQSRRFLRPPTPTRKFAFPTPLAGPDPVGFPGRVPAKSPLSRPRPEPSETPLLGPEILPTKLPSVTVLTA